MFIDLSLSSVCHVNFTNVIYCVFIDISLSSVCHVNFTNVIYCVLYCHIPICSSVWAAVTGNFFTDRLLFLIKSKNIQYNGNNLFYYVSKTLKFVCNNFS